MDAIGTLPSLRLRYSPGPRYYGVSSLVFRPFKMRFYGDDQRRAELLVGSFRVHHGTERDDKNFATTLLERLLDCDTLSAFGREKRFAESESRKRVQRPAGWASGGRESCGCYLCDHQGVFITAAASSAAIARTTAPRDDRVVLVVARHATIFAGPFAGQRPGRSNSPG
jgi:hypothetical protein